MSRTASSDLIVDSGGLRRLIAAGARAVARNQEDINLLNVFPVPDGDTGTNMSLTLAAVMDEAPEAPEMPISDVAAGMARSALLGARGNSGLILAQFFKGIASGLRGARALGGPELASGLRHAATAAYRAVDRPVEGTMLTVMREAADAAEEAAAESELLADVLEAAVARSSECVARTPTMLEILREAGVVDAGGYGLSVLLSGALSHLRGESDGSVAVAAPAPVGVENGRRAAAGPRIAFVEAAQDRIFGYCTSFLIEGERLQPDLIRARANKMGESCVVAGDDTQVKIHLHPRNPGPILTYAAGLGILSRIAVLNMDEQTKEWVESRLAAMGECKVAVVAVAAGDGLATILADAGLGASSVVRGGDTMNPSVADLLAAVERAPSDCVIILPNSRNIVGTARQVPGLTEKEVTIVPTLTVQQGIAALLAFSPDRAAEANATAMREAADAIRTASVTRATRDASVSGAAVRKGDIIGLLGDAIVASGSEANSVAIDLLCRSVVDGELITLYRGRGVSADDAEAVASAARRKLSGVDIEVVDGGQSHYPYLISIE